MEQDKDIGMVPEASSKSGCRVTASGILAIIRAQNFKCALTGRAIEPSTASIDHITPISSGGKHVLKNIQILHADVNAAKRTMTLEDFIQMCREIIAHVDS